MISAVKQQDWRVLGDWRRVRVWEAVETWSLRGMTLNSRGNGRDGMERIEAGISGAFSGK
jgi:hypothetical protein